MLGAEYNMVEVLSIGGGHDMLRRPSGPRKRGGIPSSDLKSLATIVRPSGEFKLTTQTVSKPG